MELLRARAITRYRSAAPGSGLLFDDLGLVLRAGERLGLVGPNGSGKSTLLRLLAGLEPPLEGSVVRAPGVRVAHLPQAQAALARGAVWQVASAGLADLRSVEARLAEEERRIAAGEDRGAAYQALLTEHERLGGYGAEALVREIAAALGFTAESYQRSVEGLSPGERQRLALTAALASGADVLLLDEPTNHLDVAARAWLESHLARFRGAAVIVSHDRALLAAATSQTAFLQGGRLVVESGSYLRVAKRRAAADARRARERAAEARRLELVAAELAQGRRGRAGQRPGSTAPGGAQRRRLRGRLLSAEHLSVPGVVTDVALTLSAGDRVAVMGPNGSGKSTLLDLLAGERGSADPRSRLSYAGGLKLVSVPQRSRGLADDAAVLDQARALLGDGRAQRTLADAGVPYEAWQRPPAELSGGERARAGLALALARPFDLLLLDEPDNDLDLEAVEALEAALLTRLEERNAALVIVTHDRRLAEGLGARVWSLEDGALRAYAGAPAYLRGDAPLPAGVLAASPRLLPPGGEDGQVEERQGEERQGEDWQREDWQGEDWQGELGDAAPRGEKPPDGAPQDELELERLALLERLLDPLALGERERERLEERLGEVEARLMSLYDARLPPAGPSRRLLEGGMVVYAERLGPSERGSVAQPLGESEHGSAADRLGESERGSTAELGHVELWALLAAADGASARAALRAPDRAGLPWCELRSVAGVAHLQLVEPDGACLLPWARAALLDAGARLAFTVLGARFTQHFSRLDLPGTRLKPAGDGWWRLTLDEFLALEGWRVKRRRRRRRVTA